MSSLNINNAIKDRLADLFEGKVGEEFSVDQLDKIYKEGEDRYKAKIPPGYADAKDKPGNERFGDLVIWKEILKKTEEVETAIVFVTADTKDDWFLNSTGKTLGPRPELVAEIKKFKDILFYIYPVPRFLEYAQEYTKASIPTEVLKEVQEHANQTRRARETQIPISAPLDDSSWLSSSPPYFRERADRNAAMLSSLTGVFQPLPPELMSLQDSISTRASNAPTTIPPVLVSPLNSLVET